MKHLIFCAALTCSFLIQTVYGQSSEVTSDQIIVRSYETGVMQPSMIVVSYGDGKTETVDLNNVSKTKNWVENLSTIHTVLDRIRKEGYTLISTSSFGGDGIWGHTYIYLRNDLVNVDTTK